jgi:precorrin-4/cobalt-precorrin-4 C11-methyltransferase
VVVVHRVGWPDAQVIRGTLATIRALVKDSGITRTALIFVGRVFMGRDFSDSRLYDPAHRHLLRPRAASGTGRGR